MRGWLYVSVQTLLASEALHAVRGGGGAKPATGWLAGLCLLCLVAVSHGHHSLSCSAICSASVASSCHSLDSSELGVSGGYSSVDTLAGACDGVPTGNGPRPRSGYFGFKVTWLFACCTCVPRASVQHVTAFSAKRPCIEHQQPCFCLSWPNDRNVSNYYGIQLLRSTCAPKPYLGRADSVRLQVGICGAQCHTECKHCCTNAVRL
jgi:hypothetical protein